MKTGTRLYRSAHAEDNGFAARAGFRPFELGDVESTVGERFREVALQRGDATAVVDGEQRISYTEMLGRAEEVARGLRSRWGSSGGVIAICLVNRVASLEMILGALLGDFGYFCLDPKAPEAQRGKLLEASGALWLEDGGGGASVLLPTAKLRETRGPAGLAALYATSGSTGEPKMVALPHRAILFDIGRQTNDLYLGPDDRFDQMFSYAFSASLATTFGALLNGAELHYYDAQHQMTALPEWLGKRCITVSTMTVSVMRTLCGMRSLCLLRADEKAFPAMRLLSVGGEAVHRSDVEAFRAVFPETCVLQNAMAATETRTYAQYFVPARGAVESPVPIGFPVAGKEVVVLDENGATVAAGVEGEIAIRSRYIADGYANDAELTATKFVNQSDGMTLYRTGDRGYFRADGCLVFLGRTDGQAKIRGHRVELDHVAQMIELHPGVRSAVVVTWADAAGTDQLIGYVVAEGGGDMSQKELRDFLREYLPEYALPWGFVFLPELPLNANFKVDRRRLPAPSVVEMEGDDGETVDVVRRLWQSVLCCGDVSEDDSFEDLGGDSLHAVRVLVAVHECFGCDLPPDTLYRFPTLRLFAEVVEQAMRSDSGGAMVSVFRAGGERCAFFFVAGLNGSALSYAHVAGALSAAHAAYGLGVRSRVAASAGVTVESMAAEYVTEIERLVAAEGKAVVVGYSFGGTIAFEVAAQLQRRGVVRALPVVIDMPAVNAEGVRPRTALRQVMDVARNLPAWLTQELMHFHPRAFALRSYGNLRRMARAVGGRAETEKLDPLIYFGKANLPQAYQDFLSAMYQALLRYVPKPFAGKVVLLRAKVPTLFRSARVTMGWELVARGGVEVQMIPGRHDDCLAEPFGRNLAAVLEGCAAEFELGEES